jgi:hypothetical protein
MDRTEQSYRLLSLYRSDPFIYLFIYLFTPTYSWFVETESEWMEGQREGRARRHCCEL